MDNNTYINKSLSQNSQSQNTSCDNDSFRSQKNYKNEFSDSFTWLNINDVAKAKGLKSTRGLRLAINKGLYITREAMVRGGKTYEILLESLEPDIQEIIKKEMKFQPPVPINIKEEEYPDSAKMIALARVDLLTGWINFREKERNKTQADNKFVEMYNTGYLMKHVYQAIGSTSIGSIKRWQKQYEERKTWQSLVPQYKYSSALECRTKLTDEMIDVFLKILLHPNRFLEGKAITLTINLLKTRGVENIPSPPTFRRYAMHFKRFNYDKWVLLREGEKALKDKVEQYITRDISKIEVGDVLVADGHKLAFQVINPFTGRPTRATLVGFLDWKSTALVGYEIMIEENTQCIASALRTGILNLGLIPKIVYQDNGKAFRAKYFHDKQGGVKRSRSLTGAKFDFLAEASKNQDCCQDCNFDEEGFNGIYQNLGIKPVFAKPYNARAKVIERFFKELQEEFEKMLPSYTGTSIAQKPARLMRNEKLHKQRHSENDFIPTIEQTIFMLESWLKYHHSKPCPNLPNMTIKEVLNSVQKQKIPVQRLDDLMMKTDLKTIHRNGIRFLNSDYYDEALYGIRDKVYIRYSLFDLTKVNVYTIKGEFLCIAKRVEGVHPMAYHLGTVKDMEDFRQKIVKQKQQKKRTIKAIQKYLPNEDLGFLEEKINNSMINTEIVEQKPQKKQRIKKPTSREVQMSKPLFENDSEKYEWLMNNGCTNSKDRQWLAKYIKSEEYINLYA